MWNVRGVENIRLKGLNGFLTTSRCGRKLLPNKNFEFIMNVLVSTKGST